MAKTMTMIFGMLWLLLPPGAAAGEEVCFRADADSGKLAFSGVAEGNDFAGNFRDFEVTLCLKDRDLATAKIDVRVATASATVGNRQGDEALMDEELFFVEQYPEATWTSCEIVADNDGYRANGKLTLRGLSADQTVQLKLETKGDVITLSGNAEILRLDYNVGTGEFEDTDFIRNRVDLEFELPLTPDP
jgi:polyisoprenoid-binding protein YceI